MLIRNFTFLLFISFSINARAEKCGSVDLRNNVLGEARDQGTIGWCFLHAAADMISYKIGQKVSVTELGDSYFREYNGDDVGTWEDAGFEEAGWVAKALKVAIRDGVCLEKDLPSENFVLLSDKTLLRTQVSTFSDAISRLTEIKDKLSQNKEEVHSYIHFPHVKKDELWGLLSANSFKDAWEEVVARSCQGRKLTLGNLQVRGPLWTRIFNKSSLRYIDRELNKRNVLGISYYSGFLKDINSKKKGRHASLLVGRRWNTQKDTCEYLIRNTWGLGCSSYDKSLQCEKGHVWVPRDLLKRHIRYIDYL